MLLPTRLGLATLVVLASAAAHAQIIASSFPNKPIRIVVPFAPSGGTDITARILGQKLAESWGQQVLIDNRPGAGGTLGTDIVAKASPDGYTLVLSSFGPMAIGPHVYSTLPYDPVKDLAPITLAATIWYFMVVQKSLRRAVVEYLAHYHAERNHQELGNRLIRSTPIVAAADGIVRRRQRLGGMLNSYYREAA